MANFRPRTLGLDELEIHAADGAGAFAFELQRDGSWATEHDPLQQAYPSNPSSLRPMGIKATSMSLRSFHDAGPK